jgi:uncharacterized protein (DUF1015 family)
MEICPFRGIRYNQTIVRHLAHVICPPYDVITSQQQKSYYGKSDYNAIRLELPAEGQESIAERYERAAITFRQWLKEGILQADGVPSFYLHDHRFGYLGERRVRRGVIARVKLESWGRDIYPHEETSSKARDDRLRLMQACRANVSPLFSLYRDSRGKIASLLSEASRAKPVIEPSVVASWKEVRRDDDQESHTVWAITAPEIKQELGELLSSEPLYIADGHHRYETALTYQQERLREQSHHHSLSADGFNYVMMELVDFSDPGLVVLPIHRLVRGIAPPILGELGGKLRDLFALESVPLKANGWQIASDSCLGILGLQGDSVVVLKTRHDVSLEAMMPGNRSQAYRGFGVSILNHIVLEHILGGAEDLDLAYTVDLREAHRQIKEGSYQLAFLFGPLQPGIVRAVADAQDRLPKKSTYFYPKLPAGLVINSLD